MNETAAPASGVLGDLRAALDRLTSPPLVVAAAALLLVLLLGVVGLHLWQLEPPSGGRIDTGTGDFMAFWTGAVFLHDGRGAELYNYEAQQALQSELLGGPAVSFQPYLNPPLLAVLLSPLVPLGYVHAFYVYDAVCAVLLLAGIGCLVLAAPALRASPQRTLATVFLIASFQPMIETALGGQNTAITFALLAALALALQHGATIAAALLLGFLSYKPQYAVGAGLALLFAGQWPVLAGAAFVGIVHYLVGAWWIGPGWPLKMMEFFARYRPIEVASNGGTHFSLVRAADFSLPSPVDSIVAAVGSAALVALWWRYRDLGRRGDPSWFALVLCGTMLISPHLQYYDAALLALPVGLLLANELEHSASVPLGVRVALAAAYIAYPVWQLSGTLGFQPLFVVLAAVTFWSLRACRRVTAGG